MEINQKYKIRISAGSQVLTYSCEILEKTNDSYIVRDNRGFEFEISKYSIIYSEKLNSEGGQR